MNGTDDWRNEQLKKRNGVFLKIKLLQVSLFRLISYILVLCATCMRLLILILVLASVSLKCRPKNSEPLPTISGNQPLKNEDKNKIDVSQLTVDTLSALLINNAGLDSFFFYHPSKPLQLLQTGSILNAKKKNAFSVEEINDSAYLLKIYAFRNGKFELNDSAFTTEFSSLYSGPYFEDFDFDGVNDIFIPVTISNGYAMSRGHLITVNPTNNEMTFHREVRDAANLKADKNTKTVIGDELIICDESASMDVCKRTFKWKNGRLIKGSVKCPCKGEW